MPNDLLNAKTFHRPNALGNAAGELGTETVELDTHRTPEMGTGTDGSGVSSATGGDPGDHQ